MNALYSPCLILHLLAATVWTGGHLVLALAVLPGAWRSGDAGPLREFDDRFEPLALPALIVQIVTGLALAHWAEPDFGAWFAMATPAGRLIAAKLICLLATFALAIDARLRLGRKPGGPPLRSLAIHMIAVTLLAVLLVVLGAAFRF